MKEVKTKEEALKDFSLFLFEQGYIEKDRHMMLAGFQSGYEAASKQIALEGQKGPVDESLPPSSNGDEDKLVKALKEFIAAMPTSGTIIANSLHPLWTAVEHAQAAIQSYEQSQKEGKL